MASSGKQALVGRRERMSLKAPAGEARMFGGLPQKKIAISGSNKKCILVDPGDGFGMDNGESKSLIGGSGPPYPPPGFATVHVHVGVRPGGPM